MATHPVSTWTFTAFEAVPDGWPAVPRSCGVFGARPCAAGGKQGSRRVHENRTAFRSKQRKTVARFEVTGRLGHAPSRTFEPQREGRGYRGRLEWETAGGKHGPGRVHEERTAFRPKPRKTAARSEAPGRSGHAPVLRQLLRTHYPNQAPHDDPLRRAFSYVCDQVARICYLNVAYGDACTI
jgi:hypothetical protein